VPPASPELRNASTILSRLSICFLRCCDVSVGDRRAELLGELVDVDALEQLAHGGRADVGAEGAVPRPSRAFAQRQVLVLVEQLVRLDLLLPGSSTT
jgi:hypothetical protein